MLVNIENSVLAENIRYLRKRYALSRRALSRLVGMSEYTLKDLEENRSFPLIFDRETLLRIVLSK